MCWCNLIKMSYILCEISLHLYTLTSLSLHLLSSTGELFGAASPSARYGHQWSGSWYQAVGPHCRDPHRTQGLKRGIMFSSNVLFIYITLVSFWKQLWVRQILRCFSAWCFQLVSFRTFKLFFVLSLSMYQVFSRICWKSVTVVLNLKSCWVKCHNVIKTMETTKNN